MSILAVVSSLQARGGIPSRTMLMQYRDTFACESRDHGRRTSAVDPISNGGDANTRLAAAAPWIP